MPGFAIEYRAWQQPGTLLGTTEQADSRDGYKRGMEYVRSIISEAEKADEPTDDDLYVSPYFIQICRDSEDITATYGVQWGG